MHELGRWPVLVCSVGAGCSVKPVRAHFEGAEAQESIGALLEFEPEAFLAGRIAGGNEPERRMRYCRQIIKMRIIFTGTDAPFCYLVYECDREIWNMLTPPARKDLVTVADPPERLYTSDTDFRLEFFKTLKALREKHGYLIDPYGPFALIDIRAKR